MREKWRHIIQDGNCPDESVIRAYLGGKLSSNLRFEVENHLAGCESCRDFSEGLAMLSEDKLTGLEVEVKEYIHQNLAPKRSKYGFPLFKRLAVAASILLAISAGTLLWFTTNRPSESKLAYKEEHLQPATQQKNNSPVSIDPNIDLAQDSEEEITAPEETFVSPAPVPEESNEPEPADYEIEFSYFADNEVVAIPEALEELVPETTQTATKSTLAKAQSIPSIPEKAIKKIQGQVVEASTGEPLPGTMVNVKGTTTFALTDVDGFFEIPVNDQAGILEFSFVGYDNETIPLTDTSQFKIEMKENLLALDEVVVVGYEVQKKRMVTGAMTTEKHSASKDTNGELLPAKPHSTGNDVYDNINLIYYHLQLGNKEKALSFFDKHRDITRDALLPEAIIKAERLTREGRLKKATNTIKTWLEENNP